MREVRADMEPCGLRADGAGLWPLFLCRVPRVPGAVPQTDIVRAFGAFPQFFAWGLQGPTYLKGRRPALYQVRRALYDSLEVKVFPQPDGGEG